ncbi:GpE family phage tail protein [Escherichia sp. WS436]|uniref:GpE family phage tail protein n=1 Tax=Escherichia sp. WS436 TaxID=3381991 RepID=UPI0018489C75|nr:GpE family phage tail protein [Escherichia coli]
MTFPKNLSVDDLMADVAVIFHWPPPALMNHWPRFMAISVNRRNRSSVRLAVWRPDSRV